MDKRPIVAITMGDPAGIGPEIAVKTLQVPDIYSISRPLIVGDLDCVMDASAITNSQSSINVINLPDKGQYKAGTIDLIDLDNIAADEIEYGQITAQAGNAAYEYVDYGIRLALAGEIDAVVTCPIHKESLNLAGHRYSGHTEIFADLTNTRDYAMMLADGDFRIVHVTTHVPLRDACNMITTERVVTVILLANESLQRLGIAEPRIGVAGLNPHAGEGGLFGTEEIEAIAPAVEKGRALGVNVEGPIPPDTLFPKARGGQYDAAVAMYHDQGHIAMKTAGFRLDRRTSIWESISGVNVTLGLPIVRVSVDHGTAFDRAGKGTANPQSLVQAIELAARFTRGK